MNLTQTMRNLFAAPTMPAPYVSKAQMTGPFAGILDDMAKPGRRQYDTVDTDAAYALAVTSAWVYSDIKLIADRISAKDARFEAETPDDEKTVDHPFLLLMRRPNSLMSGSFLKRYTAWWLLLRGNAYIFVSTARQGSGEPVELWPLQANQVRPLPETLRYGKGAFRDELVIDYEYNVAGKLEPLAGENVIHFRLPNPFDYWEGLSPLTAALLGVQHDHAQQRWQRDFFAVENAIPSAIISVPATTSPVDFERQRDILSQQMKEGQKRLFTRSGDLTVETITQTLEQMQIIDSRRFNRDEIDRIYGIPEGLISGGLSGDSRLAAEIAFARNTVQPLLDYMAEQLTADIAPFYGDGIKFEAPNVIPQDRALEAQEYTIYSQDRTVDENRAELGLEPIQLPPEIADLATVPVRLLSFVKTAPDPQPPPTMPDNQPNDQITQDNQQGDNSQPDQPPDMIGSQAPANVADQQSGKSAVGIALAAELKRWQKVALREFKAKRNPAARSFESVVIDTDHRASILAALEVAADESEVKAAFDAAPFRVAGWEAYP